MELGVEVKHLDTDGKVSLVEVKKENDEIELGGEVKHLDVDGRLIPCKVSFTMGDHTEHLVQGMWSDISAQVCVWIYFVSIYGE